MTKELRYGAFRFEGEQKYGKIRCEREGIYITYESAPASDGCIYLQNNYRQNMMPLPKRVLKEYQFGDIELVKILDTGEYFIETKKKVNKIPIVYDCQVKAEEAPILSNGVRRKNKLLNCGRISLNATLGTDVIIEFHNDGCGYIKIYPYNGEDIPGLVELKGDYGANLLGYPYETLRYRYNGLCNKKSVKNGGISSVSISAFILKKLKSQNGDYFQYVEMNDGSVILTPLPKTCDLEKREIDPVREKAFERVICKDCAEDKDDIHKLNRMYESIMDLCQSVTLLVKSEAEERKETQKRLQKLEEKLLS